MVRDKDEVPQEDPWQCAASLCSSSVLMGDLGVSRSVDCDSLSVLLIYPRIF